MEQTKTLKPTSSDRPRLWSTKNVRRLYRVAGWLALTCLDTRGSNARPIRWRRVYNVTMLLSLFFFEVFVVGIYASLAASKATQLTIYMEFVTRSLLLLSLVLAFNQPGVLRALDRTADIMNLELSHEELRREVKAFDWFLFVVFSAHFLHEVANFLEFLDYFHTDEFLPYTGLAITRTDLPGMMVVYALHRSPTVYTCILRSIMAMVYFQLRCRFRILLSRIQQIQYELEVSGMKWCQNRTLIHISRALDAHETLRGSVREVTECMRWALLASMLHTLTKLVVTSYFYVVTYRGANSVSPTSHLSSVLSFGVIVIYIVWFSAICEPCHRLIDMDRQLVELAACCLLRASSEGEDAPAHALESLRRTVERRAETRLRLDVLGVCQVNRLLLVKIVYVASTYLILLVQYQFNKL